MDESEKIAVGYEAGMMLGGAGLSFGGMEQGELNRPRIIGSLNSQQSSDYYDSLVARGMPNMANGLNLDRDPAKQAQEMPNRIGLNIGQQFAPKVAHPLDDALTGFIYERDALAKVVAALTERLKPVLRPIQQTIGAGGGGGQAGVPPVSPVVAALRSECAAFAAQRCVLSALLSRLDL